jgi:hypothetical protein
MERLLSAEEIFLFFRVTLFSRVTWALVVSDIYLTDAVNQQSADPMVFVATVDELEIAIPVENFKPVIGTSKAKLAPESALNETIGVAPSAGTVVELKI